MEAWLARKALRSLNDARKVACASSSLTVVDWICVMKHRSITGSTGQLDFTPACAHPVWLTTVAARSIDMFS